jgi:hypothetical protein
MSANSTPSVRLAVGFHLEEHFANGALVGADFVRRLAEAG